MLITFLLTQYCCGQSVQLKRRTLFRWAQQFAMIIISWWWSHSSFIQLYVKLVFVSKSSVDFTLTCINASSLKIARVAGVLEIFGKKIFLYHFCQIIPKRISCSVWSKNKGGAGGGLSPWSVTACYEASFHNPVYLVIFREWPFCSKDKEILQAIASERQRKAYKGLIQI